MHTKRAGFALLAAALLIAVVGSAVSANVLRVGMTDYEVYPCNYNANAGYYVPWDGNAAGQFWISAPVWEWGGEGGALCADSDGDWRDNGVREGDPNPNFGDEYRRAQSAVNARQAAFSRSLVSLAEQIERGIREAEERTIADAGTATPTTGNYNTARAECIQSRRVAQEASANAEEYEAALLAYNSCIGRAITTYSTEARNAYSALQAACANNNDRATVQGETGYQACLSEGRNGGYRERTVRVTYAKCATFDDPEPDPDGPPGHTYTLCEQVPILDGDGNPITRDGRVLMQVNLVPLGEENARRPVLVFDEEEAEEDRVYTLPIPDPETTLNPSPTPDPAATPDPTPEPTAQYGQERDSDNNLITFDQAHFSGPDPCDTIIDFVDNYWDNLGDSEKESQRWINTRDLVRQVDDDNFCDEFDD